MLALGPGKHAWALFGFIAISALKFLGVIMKGLNLAVGVYRSKDSYFPTLSIWSAFWENKLEVFPRVVSLFRVYTSGSQTF